MDFSKINKIKFTRSDLLKILGTDYDQGYRHEKRSQEILQDR